MMRVISFLALISLAACTNKDKDATVVETDTSSVNPVLGTDGMTLKTTSNSAVMSYKMEGDALTPGDNFRIAFRMKLVSQSTAAAHRAGAQVTFRLASDKKKNSLYIGDDEVFLLASENARGSAASVDTTAEFHEYVINVNRLTDEVTVFQDGVLVLTDDLFITSTDLATPVLSFGNGTTFSQGESVWQSFEHSAWTACPFHGAWDVSESILPDADAPAWTLVDNSSTDPVLGNDGVTLTTNSNGETLHYTLPAGTFPSDELVKIRFRMRSDSSSAAAAWRAARNVTFAFGDDIDKNALYIGDDEIFLLAAENSKGASPFVGTTNDFHEYAIEVDRGDGSVTVFRDGVETLTGAPFQTSTDTLTDRISWGQGSAFAQGSGVWSNFEVVTRERCVDAL